MVDDATGLELERLANPDVIRRHIYMLDFETRSVHHLGEKKLPWTAEWFVGGYNRKHILERRGPPKLEAISKTVLLFQTRLSG